jgi:glycosyltransferase involved in cell wall biosynthesis
MAFSVGNMLRPSAPFRLTSKAPSLQIRVAGGEPRFVQLAPATSARAGIVSSSALELVFDIVAEQAGYLVEIGNRASFNAPQNTYSQAFGGGENISVEVDARDSTLPEGCALYLIVFDATGNRLQQFRAGIGSGRNAFDAVLHPDARKGCFALRLVGKGRLLQTGINISPASTTKKNKPRIKQDPPVALKRVFPQTYRTASALADYLPGIAVNLPYFERVALRERSLRTRELFVQAISGGVLSYDGLIAFLRNMRGLSPRGPVRAALRFDDRMLKGLLALARVVFSQRLEPDDTREALELYEAVADMDIKVFRQIDWVPFVLLSAEFRGAEAALSALHKSRFDVENNIEPALLMSNILRKRAIENGEQPDPHSHLVPVNRQLQAMSLEPITVKSDSPSAFLSLDTGALDSVVTNGPKVSVLMTTYDPDDTLDVAVRSVLGQSWRNLELIIIDDCSRDDIFAKVRLWEQRDSRVRVMRTPRNQGTYAAKNLGLATARGEFVTCHDSDDWSHPRKLELQMETLAEKPSSLSVISHWVRTSADLMFQAFSAGGFLCYENLSSMLYRREPVGNLVGFYDAVRTGADSEFRKRLERASGQSLLTTGKIPLSFGLLHDRSLTATSLGLGWFSPERHEYRAAAKHWLDEMELAGNGFRLECNPAIRPFSVRRSLMPDRAQAAEARAHYDVVIASEFRMVGGNTLSSIEELKAQSRAGLKTAICQVNSFRKGVVNKEYYPPQIHAMLNRGEIDHIDLTSNVTTKVLNIRYPAVFQFARGITTAIEAETIQVIVNQPPAEADSRDRRYDVGECIANIRQVFGADPKWLPIGPNVRDALDDVPADLLSPSDWFNIIDVDEWAAPRKRFVSDRPVIGRHARDDVSKWPETAENLYAAYPNDARYVVRVLGGAQAIQNAGFEVPSNWNVLEFNSVPPSEFLRGIDFFVYFHHSQRIEAFGRTVIEAMASGCVAILPETFRPLVGDAAIYCEPRDVKSVVDRYYANFELYRAQSEKALRFVRENFGYEKHIARLAQLGVVANGPGEAV